MRNLTLIRPVDTNETAVAWPVAIETRDRPVLPELNPQDLPTLDRIRHASVQGLHRGAYVRRELTLTDAHGSASQICSFWPAPQRPT